MNKNSKLTQSQLGVVSVFALTLALTSPAFAQCLGGVCRIQQNATCASCARASYAYAPTAPLSASGYQTQTCGTFAPFGGFFRGLFGGCRFTSSTAAAAPARGPAKRSCGTARGSFCTPCSGATYLADPVGRENAPDATTDREFATEAPEPGTDAALYEAVEKMQAEPCGAAQTCKEDDNCEPCGAVRATWLEKKLFDCANAQRRAAGLRPFLFDGRLIQWARINSSLQARYCRLGHFSGYGAEIAGEGYTTPEAAVQGWLGSAPHRVILLNGGYTRCGCACYQGANGKFYWTMSFGR